MRMIEVSNLTKKFGEITAVDNLSFQVEEGGEFGLLGPNGAGKTTTEDLDYYGKLYECTGKERKGSLIMLPFAAVYVLSEINILPLTSTNLLWMGAALVVLDVISFYMVKATFQRDEILTKWK
jgi:ABC-type uncharacterized transport system ATPase subunit